MRRAQVSVKAFQLDVFLGCLELALVRLGAARLALTTSISIVPLPTLAVFDASASAMLLLSVPSSMERKLPPDRRLLGAQEMTKFHALVVMAT